MRPRARALDDAALSAIEAVYRERLAAFVRMAWAITRDEQVARDAVHDSFVRAVRHRKQLRSAGSASGWIARIVVREAVKRRATEARYVELSSEPAAAEAGTNGRAEHGALVAAIAALPERQRLALFLRYYADLDQASIAEALGVAPGTVAAALHAARANLQAKLEEAPR